MTKLSDSDTKSSRIDSATPTAVAGSVPPRATIVPQIVSLEESLDLGPFLREAEVKVEVEKPAPVTKLVPRKPLEPIRVSVLAEPAKVQPPATVQSPRVVAGLARWRNTLLGLLALLVVVQSGFMLSWMLASEDVPRTTGSVTVTSSPSESPVRIDGVTIGQTPLTLSLAAGSHRVEVGSGAQLTGQDVSVAGGGSASFHVELARASIPTAPAAAPAPQKAAEPADVRATSESQPRAAAPAVLPTGWLAVTSGIPMQVLEKGKLVGTSEMPRIGLPPGVHELELVNVELGYRVYRNVEIAPGQATTLGLKPPMGTLAVNALPWAEVWIDGQRAGETPIGNLSIPIGSHEILFRHPELGEQRRLVTVGALGPARVGVDMRKP